MPDIRLQRRDLLVAPLLAALIPVTARASILDPAETILTLPANIPWKPVRKRRLLRADQMVPWLHERAAHLRDRPALRGRVRNLVGQQRRRIRPSPLCASVPRHLRASHRAYAAL
jgi:hypothetical protein